MALAAWLARACHMLPSGLRAALPPALKSLPPPFWMKEATSSCTEPKTPPKPLPPPMPAVGRVGRSARGGVNRRY
jgi:hypothetical protein